jgi:predicted nucleotidyltransferase
VRRTGGVFVPRDGFDPARSDIDVLADFKLEATRGIGFRFFGYGDERAGILGRKVDFCSRLDPRLEPSIRRDDLHWKDIAGTRDHLIHGYDLIDHRVLWDAVHIDVPRLIEAIDELLG